MEGGSTGAGEAIAAQLRGRETYASLSLSLCFSLARPGKRANGGKKLACTENRAGTYTT